MSTEGNGGTMVGTHSTHPLVRRIYADVCGTADELGRVVHEGYDHNFPDTELVATAKQRGLYVHTVECVIEHLHPRWGKAPLDAIYALGRKRLRQDRALFEQSMMTRASGAARARGESGRMTWSFQERTT